MLSRLRGFLYTTLASLLLGGSFCVGAAEIPTPPLDLNQATAKQLTTLKGIGDKRAQAIVTYRQAHGPFHQLNDLAKVPGMSPVTTEKVLQKNPGRLILGKM